MAQFGRPSADTYNSDGWTEDDGTSDALYGEIDETSANDSDYIRSPLTPTSDVYVCKLSNLEDPLSSSSHTVRYRYCKDAAGGDQIDLTVQLRQGYVNEGSPGTLIATVGTHTDISETWTAGSYTLSAGEADAITDYTSLYLRFVANKP
jgi:hypothetical protein